MEPVTRAQLQYAPADAAIRKQREIIRRQQVEGQVWAERVYKQIRVAAEEGKSSYECNFPSDMTDVGRDYAVKMLKAWFPDSDHRVIIYGALKGHPQAAVRITWCDIPVKDLEDRRFERETSW